VRDHWKSRRLERIVDGELDALRRVAARLTGDALRADDLVQETCLRAWRSRHGLRHDDNLKAWLFKVLRSVWIDLERRARREPALVELPPDSALPATPPVPPPPSDIADRAELERCFDQELLSAIDQLLEEERFALLYQTFGQMSYKEIAEALDCPVGTVMSRLHRARAKLRMTLADYARERGITSTTETNRPRRHGAI